MARPATRDFAGNRAVATILLHHPRLKFGPSNTEGRFRSPNDACGTVVAVHRDFKLAGRTNDARQLKQRALPEELRIVQVITDCRPLKMTLARCRARLRPPN